MSQLPAGSYTTTYVFIADASTATLIALDASTTSVIIKAPSAIDWVALDFGDNTVVAVKATSKTATIAGYPIDEPRPSLATHASVIASAAGELIVIEKRP